MTSPTTSWFSSASVSRWQEVQKSEFRKYSTQIRDVLETVCTSSSFRSSSRSCEFLRHIVLHSLEGDTDALKERLIGMVLLGRDAAYDTSTDAGVRVRANDVRKRLNNYNKTPPPNAEIQIQLPAGSYVPLFLLSGAESGAESEEPGVMPGVSAADAPPLSYRRLAVPTLAALFVCIICMRWQFAQEHSFSTFWSQVLRDDRALLYMQPLSPGGGQDVVDVRELRLAAPLLDLAGEFHHKFTLIGTLKQVAPADAVLLAVGPALPAGIGKSVLEGSSRFRMAATPNGRRIIDAGAKGPFIAGADQGSLLTIMNGAPDGTEDGTRWLIWIDGTDDAAIQSLVERLCDQVAFPEDLATSFRPGTETQAVFPAGSRSGPLIVRFPLVANRASNQVPDQVPDQTPDQADKQSSLEFAP
jgi:hypothetical protein